MSNFEDHLRDAKGNILKARRTYIKERRWRGDEWYHAWDRGLAVEIESACKAVR